MKLLNPKEILIESENIKDVKHFSKIVSKRTILDMVSIAREKNGLAIAAPQVGIFYKFFISLFEQDEKIKIYINPRYYKLAESKRFQNVEGCLSYGKAKYKVERFDQIFANWIELIDGKFQEQFLKLDGLESVMFQHETDHLSGITIATKGTKIR